MSWIRPTAVFDGNHLSTDTLVRIEDDRVVETKSASDQEPGDRVDSQDVILAPGLFDTQVNGGGGVMLNSQPTRAGVVAIALAHRAAGTSFILPTVITDAPEITEKAALAVLDERGRNGVLGIHIEGPHISHAHRGTHDTRYIRPLDDLTFDLISTLRGHDLPVLLTLAPETTEPGQIETLSKMGVVVSVGHSAATGQQTAAALREGARSFTHLFNGMPQMTSRNPGLVGAAIDSDVWCGFIADGHHVDFQMLRLAIRARGAPDRMVLVSDAMSTVGGPDHFEIYGETIRVEGGRLVNAAGSLAGAHIDLATSLSNLVVRVGTPLADAIRMATTNPREMMRLPQQILTGTKTEDLAWLPGSLARCHETTEA